MRELELAVHSSIEPERPRAGWRAGLSLPRAAFFASIAAHVVGGYALSLHKWVGSSPATPTPDFFLFELPAPRPAEPVSEPAPTAPLEEPASELEERPSEVLPPPRAAEVVPEPAIAVEAPSQPSEPVPVEEVSPTPFIDLDEERRRAAREVVTERTAESAYLTFSMDDVAPPRAAPEPEPPPSIFDAGGSSDFGGRSVATVGQQRTRLGRKLVEFCNALTGGFGVAFQGFGLFSACASPDDGPSGLLPEVRPAYLDLMPECVDTRDTAPALALEAPFPTVKCRLVKREDRELQP
jgi:hypothetical protein